MNTTSPQVAVVDFHLGNLFSVQRACETVGLTAEITSDKSRVLAADAVILPGVGAFADAMNNLTQLDLISPIKDFISSGKPLLGICLGLQLLMSESEEFGHFRGLDIFSGRVKKFQTPNGHAPIKIPHVGWNRILKNTRAWDGSLLEGLLEGDFMYFVHSYCIVPEQKDILLSLTNYEGVEYCSSVSSGNVFACQFHPERSAQRGLKIYQNFASLIKKIKVNYERPFRPA